MHQSPPTEVGAGTIFYLAAQARAAREAEQRARSGAGDDPGSEDDPLPPLDDTPVLSAKAPLISAQAFISARYTTTDGVHTLLHQRGAFYTWCGTHYIDVIDEEVRASTYGFLNKALQRSPKGKLVSFDPNKTKVANVLEATAAQTQLASTIRQPVWLDNKPHPPAAEIIACANGLLHLPTRILSPHDPAFFNSNALSFDHDADALPPDEWLDFLATLWGDDPESIDTLQELFGLLLTGDTSQQKLFMLVGPPRCGKGTIARVLAMLLGRANVCSPTLSSLAETFGMQPLIGTRLATIADARLGGRVDQSVIVERLLSVSGEDAQTIARKGMSAWNGNLETRFLILTNELPRLTDVSGAMASRFITFVLTKSFYGKEDRGLTSRIAKEMPSVLNWAIDGWQRLTERGYFIPPASASEAQRDMEDLGSPIGAFLRQRCIIEPARKIDCALLYHAWDNWCRDNGRDHVGTVQMFGRDLRAAAPSVRLTNNRKADGSEGRVRSYEGISLGSKA